MKAPPKYQTQYEGGSSEPQSAIRNHQKNKKKKTANEDQVEKNQHDTDNQGQLPRRLGMSLRQILTRRLNIQKPTAAHDRGPPCGHQQQLHVGAAHRDLPQYQHDHFPGGPQHKNPPAATASGCQEANRARVISWTRCSFPGSLG